MVYIDTRGMSDEERTKKRRTYMLEELSIQSDLKKAEREDQTLRDELRRLEQERDRTEMYIKEHKDKMRTIADRTAFLQDELRRIKKMMIEIG